MMWRGWFGPNAAVIRKNLAALPQRQEDMEN